MIREIRLEFEESNQDIAVTVEETSQEIAVELEAVQTLTKFVNEPYEGDYEVVPKVTAQTMPTKDKVLSKDITVKSIPFFNVSNTSGGETIYIGEEI